MREYPFQIAKIDPVRDRKQPLDSNFDKAKSMRKRENLEIE
jgi:hypothetical protein